MENTEIQKYNPETLDTRSIPNQILSKVYDKDDYVLFGSRYVKGKVMYNYIPAEFMTTGRPFIVSSSISYDGEGNSTLPEGSLVMEFTELPTMFPDNKFS